MYIILSRECNDTLTCFLICIPSIFLSYFIALAKTFPIMQNIHSMGIQHSRKPCPATDFSEIALSFSV